MAGVSKDTLHALSHLERCISADFSLYNRCLEPVTDCFERKRLAEELRVATKELQWLLDEECRIILTDPIDLMTFESVVQDGEARWRNAFETYRGHVTTHGCAAKVRSVGN